MCGSFFLFLLCCSYDPSCIATMRLLLRRTLVRPVIQFGICEMFLCVQPAQESESG